MGLATEMSEYFRDYIIADLRKDKERELGQPIPDDIWFKWVHEVTGLVPAEEQEARP